MSVLAWRVNAYPERARIKAQAHTHTRSRIQSELIKPEWRIYAAVNKPWLTIIGLDNALSPGRREAIIRNNAGIWILLMEPQKQTLVKSYCNEWNTICNILENVLCFVFKSCLTPKQVQAIWFLPSCQLLMVYSRLANSIKYRAIRIICKLRNYITPFPHNRPILRGIHRLSMDSHPKVLTYTVLSYYIHLNNFMDQRVKWNV